ncbi:CHAP domain-containing protein [Nonomuraea sediminis]|uniref:CHAP domain-containing protein n=1 Tax=Nonomuraea sediminis TaxID=2835864 RepID=UPI001BDD54D3|nr:CHAP domain-containing protein [Nonomuraea sediminis]
MSPEMKKYIDLLESQLGYSEKAGAYTKFGDWYGKNVEFDADYSSSPWCDMYLSWAADKLGFENWIGQFAFTQAHAEWFKEHDAWGHKPQPGAFVFYDWGGSKSIDGIDHVGVVTKVVGDRIFTIEGNIDGGTAKRKERDTSKVVGYGYPEKIKERLDAEAIAKQQDEEQSSPPADPEVGTLQLPENDLASLIHPPEAASRPVPLAAGAPAGSPAPTPTAAPKKATPRTSPQPIKSPKKGKHAKPATADTQAATTQPLPVITAASAARPLPALNSPTLLGSAMVAALAVLAVAKTRQRRVRLATATTRPATTRARGHRRAPSRRTRHVPQEPLLETALPTPTTELPETTLPAMELAATTLPAPATELVATTSPASATTTIPAPATEAAETAFTPQAFAGPGDVLAASIAAARALAIPEATTPFDAFAPPAAETRQPVETWPAQETAPEALLHGSPAEPRRRVEPGHHTLRESRPEPYRGHRRQEAKERIRRRRGTRPEEPRFDQDAPLRGRRHRPAVQEQTRRRGRHRAL